MPKSAEPEPEVSDHESSGEESEEEGPCLKLQDIGTFAAQGGEITMKMQPVKAKKAKKVKKKKKKEEKEEECTCEKNENCPDLSHNEDLPDADLDTILDRYAALFTGKPDGLDNLLYWQRCPLAHAEVEILAFARSELLKNDIFPNEETLEKNVYKLITLVSAGLVPGLKAEHTGKIDKAGCETIKIIQKHGNKKPVAKVEVKKEKNPSDGCCKACFNSVASNVKDVLSCKPCRDACTKAWCKKPELELVRTGFPNFYLTEQQITDIATKLDEEDGNGFLEGPEIKTLGIWMRYRLTDGQLDEACEKMGAVGDTGVSYDKFGKWINSKDCQIASSLRKSLFPQEINIPKHLATSPFVTNDQIALMVEWIKEDNLDKSGSIKHEKLAGIASMEIMKYCPRLNIDQSDVDAMLQSLNLVSKTGEKLGEKASCIDFAGWINGNDVLAWKLRSILPYVEPAKDDWYPYAPTKAGTSSCHGSNEWNKVNACCVQSCCAGICCLLPRVGGKGGGIFGRCFNAACCPCQAPCCIHHCKPPPKRPLQPPRTCGKIIGCDCWCWHATCTWYPRCFPACLCCDEEEIDGSPATYFARTMFFPNEAIDIYDGQVDAWEDTNQDAPEEQKEAPDMERSA